MIGETVTRLRSGTASDRYGDDASTGTPAEVAVDGALFAPGGSPQTFQIGRQPVIDQPVLYFLRQWPDIVQTDKIRVRGTVYEVDGDPEDWRSAYGSGLGGLVVKLKKVSG